MTSNVMGPPCTPPSREASLPGSSSVPVSEPCDEGIRRVPHPTRLRHQPWGEKTWVWKAQVSQTQSHSFINMDVGECVGRYAKVTRMWPLCSQHSSPDSDIE